MGDLAKLYYDLFGNEMPKQCEALRKMTSNSHLLYGTDEPFTSIFICTCFSEAIDSSVEQDVVKMIYYKNALKLFLNATV